MSTAAVSYVGGSTATGLSSGGEYTRTLSLPGARQPGDMAILVRFWDRNEPSDPRQPSGWTPFAVQRSGTRFDPGATMVASWRMLDGTETSSIEVTGAFRTVWVLLVFRGAASPEAWAGYAQGNATSVVAPSITTGEDNGWVLTALAHVTATGITTPSGSTARPGGVVNSNGTTLRTSTFAMPTAGSTGTRSGTANDSGRWVALQIELPLGNLAPHAPIIKSPDGETVDRNAPRRFRWQFADPNPDDTQSAYDLRYRKAGTTSWTTVSAETANTWRDFPAGTFDEAAYEWQVRTADAQGLVGPWSSTATFDAEDAPAGPSITEPVVDETISTERYTVRWSASEQDDFQLRRVADNSGQPNTGQVLFDTGTVASQSARSLDVDFPDNDQTEHVQVRVRRQGLWSPWSSRRVHVSYTVPAVPAVTVWPDDGTLVVQAQHPSPGSGQPQVTSITVWSRTADESTSVDRQRPKDAGVRLRDAVEIPPSAPFVDRAVASGVAYEYQVQAHGDNGTSVMSEWVGTLSPPPEPIPTVDGGGPDTEFEATLDGGGA